MNRSDGLAVQLLGDGEEGRLLAILEACKAALAAQRALSNPTDSVLLPEARKLENDLEVARSEFEKSTEALREYRHGQPMKNSE